jgi:hypothetical protein
MSAFGGKADATTVVALLASSRVVATSHRIRASEQVVPREEQEKDNRQHDADQDKSTSPRSMTCLAWRSQWCMTTVGSDTALRGGSRLYAARHCSRVRYWHKADMD